MSNVIPMFPSVPGVSHDLVGTAQPRTAGGGGVRLRAHVVDAWGHEYTMVAQASFGPELLDGKAADLRAAFATFWRVLDCHLLSLQCEVEADLPSAGVQELDLAEKPAEEGGATG